MHAISRVLSLYSHRMLTYSSCLKVYPRERALFARVQRRKGLSKQYPVPGNLRWPKRSLFRRSRDRDGNLANICNNNMRVRHLTSRARRNPFVIQEWCECYREVVKVQMFVEN